MDGDRDVFTVGGKAFVIPVAEGRGDFVERTRWRLLREGLEDWLRAVPRGERVIQREAQRLWRAVVVEQVRHGREVENSWPTLLSSEMDSGSQI